MLNEPITNADEAVHLRRVVGAPRERVFRAWTDASRLERWFGPAGYTARAVKLDARAGGEYEIAMQPPAPDAASPAPAPHSIVGRYREVTPPRRLVFTWMWTGDDPPDDGESLVSIDFLSVPDGTEIRITHEHLASDEAREGHLAGWAGSLDRLEAMLS